MNAKWCAIAVLTVIVGAFVAHASDLIPKYEYELDEVLLLRVDLTDPNTSGRADPCSITYTIYDVNTADDTLTAVTGIEDVNMTGPRVSKPGVYMSLVTLSEPNFAEGGTYMVIIDVNMAGVLGEKSGVFAVVAAESASVDVDEIYARIAPLVPTDFNNVGITANNLHVHLKAADDNVPVDPNMADITTTGDPVPLSAVSGKVESDVLYWLNVAAQALADSDDNQADMRTVLDARGMTQAWAGDVATTNTTVATNLDAAISSRLSTAGYTALSADAVTNLNSYFGDLGWAEHYDSTNQVLNVGVTYWNGAAAGALVTREEGQADSQAGAAAALTAQGYTSALATAIGTTNSTVATNLDAAVSSRSSHSAANVLTALGTGSWITAMPWNAAWDAEIESETNDALVAIHLDHLFAADYDPASKPGVATALLNELIESDSGVSRFTENALEQAGATPEEIWAYIIDGSVTAKQWAASSLASMVGITTITDHGTTRTNKYYKQDDTTIQYQITYRESNGSRTTGGEIEP